MSNIHDNVKILTEEEKMQLERQNTRIVPTHKANMLEIEARKYWDLFYKRNETRFFKDRHWSTREFKELLNDESAETRLLLEVGCGVGNFIFPLVEDKINFKIIACDFSPRAVDLVKKNPLYNESIMSVFQTDITSEEIFKHVGKDTVDVITLIFVLSAIHPDKFVLTLRILRQLLKPGGVILFRDYGLYDMAQLRFKPGHKIDENLYMRQDGTRSYYFSLDFANNIFVEADFEVISNTYINRRTVNKKENIDVPRIYIQSKIRKPLNSSMQFQGTKCLNSKVQEI